MSVSSTEIVLSELNNGPATARTISHRTGLSLSNVRTILNILVNADVLENSYSERTGEKLYLSRRRCSKCKRVIMNENKEISRLRKINRNLRRKENTPEPKGEANEGGALEAQ